MIVTSDVYPHVLTLGYEDDYYLDDSYDSHDDGTENQCLNVGPAWVILTVERPGGAPPTVPFDLTWLSVDVNGIPWNPEWSYQVNHPGELPDPVQLCNKAPDSPACTTQPTYRDSGFFCGAHVNWRSTTYDGQLHWAGHDSDDDYNFRLWRADRAGSDAPNGSQGLLLEFDSDETIDHFSTPWWNAFHKAVDDNNALATDMVADKYAIVTGLIGQDCYWSCGTEIHPVWAMAVRVNEDPNDETWAIFVRNWATKGSAATWITCFS